MTEHLGRSGGAKRGVGETRALVKRYAEQGLTVREMAALLGVSTQAVYEHLASLGISPKTLSQQEAV